MPVSLPRFIDHQASWHGYRELGLESTEPRFTDWLVQVEPGEIVAAPCHKMRPADLDVCYIRQIL